MSKFVKGSLTAAGVLAALGCILCMISTLAGGRSAIYWAQNDDYMEEKLEKVGDKLGDALSKIHIGNWHLVWRNNGIAVGFGEDENPTELTINNVTNSETNPDGRIAASEQHIEADEVRNLNLSLGAGTFIIKEKEASDGIIDIYIQGIGGCDYRVKNGTFYIEGFKGIKVIGSDISENVITLVLPAGMSFDEVDVEVGAGVMEIYDLMVKELDADVGAGELSLKDIEARELSTEIGAGRLSAENVSTKDADIAVSMGECVYKGTISENLDAECDMGNMEFYLSGTEKDHNYDIECAAGNIDMGSYSFTALAAEREIDNGARGTFDISCNMGNITVCFEN